MLGNLRRNTRGRAAAYYPTADVKGTAVRLMRRGAGRSEAGRSEPDQASFRLRSGGWQMEKCRYSDAPGSDGKRGGAGLRRERAAPLHGSGCAEDPGRVAGVEEERRRGISQTDPESRSGAERFVQGYTTELAVRCDHFIISGWFPACRNSCIFFGSRSRGRARRPRPILQFQQTRASGHSHLPQ